MKKVDGVALAKLFANSFRKNKFNKEVNFNLPFCNLKVIIYQFFVRKSSLEPKVL